MMYHHENSSTTLPPGSSSSQHPLSPPTYELNTMAPNDAIVTVTDPHYAEDFPCKEKKKRVHIRATEIHDPRDPRKRPGMGRRQTTFGENDVPEHQLTPLGKALSMLLDNSIIRYCIYVLPVAAGLAVPLVLYWVVPNYKDQTIPRNSKKHGIRTVGLIAWLEVVWVAFWVAKLIAGAVPFVFQSICGIFSTGIRKYALVFRACEIPISLFIWSIIVYCSQPILWLWSKQHHYNAYAPISVKGKKTAGPGISWLDTTHKLCTATIGVAALYLAEKLLVQLIAVNYHKRQFSDRIASIKRISLAIDRLYDASLRRYPDHHKEFMDFDYDIHDTNGVQKNLSKLGADRSTMRFIGDMGWVSDKMTNAFGRLASDMTGKEIKPTGNHAVVEQALERKYGAEALARRIFKALDKENDDAITEQDLIEELGPGNEEEARFIFDTFDRDHNGDVSLEEMISLVGSIAKERKLMWRSAVDVKEALKILDRAMETVVLILVLLIYAAFFSTYLATHYTQIWGSITGLSFMLGPTASELLSACILVFVKHPYDVGDRVDMSGFELVVTRISLLYTTFRRIDTDRSVQVPNAVINTLWVENVSRSPAMKERLTFSVSPGTSFDDIETLRRELHAFVSLPENKRDYYDDLDVEILSVGDLKQLDLRVEIRHKTNWSDESLRAYRRSKFMCALLSAMRKVPIAGPGGDGPVAGTLQNPNYAVSVPDEVAHAAREKFDAEKDAKRLFPKNGGMFDAERAMSSGLDLLPSLMKRKASAVVVNPFAEGAASKNPFR
jgi:small-conductance mechanosensitive channel